MENNFFDYFFMIALSIQQIIMICIAAGVVMIMWKLFKSDNEKPAQQKGKKK